MTLLESCDRAIDGVLYGMQRAFRCPLTCVGLLRAIEHRDNSLVAACSAR